MTEIDIGAEFFAELGQKVHETHSRVHRSKPKPIRKPVGGSVVIPAGFSGSGPVLLPVQGNPSHGRCWNILKIGVFGADTHTVVATVTADVFAGDVVEYPIVATNFMDAVLTGVAVPSITQFSKEVEWCYSGQTVYAYLNGSGLAAGQQYELIARVAEYKVDDVEARSTS
jgi:hypothetical protein